MMVGPGVGVPRRSLLLASASLVSIATDSLIFTSGSSQFLSRTGRVDINQQKFTFATWFKCSTAAGQTFLYLGDGTTNNRVIINLTSAGVLVLRAFVAAAQVCAFTTTAAFDDGAWHRMVWGVDTTQATDTNKVRLEVDGVLITSFSTAVYPPLGTSLPNNFAATQNIGAQTSSSSFLNAKLAQTYYIDGQQVSDAKFNTAGGLPKTYSGSYTGVFDFFLPFSNGASTTTLGADASGEGNNWTLNAMTTANQSTDHP